MKTQLSAFDIYTLVNELRDFLPGSKIQKIQCLDERGLKLKVYSKKNSGELILMPNYFCITKTKRKFYSEKFPEQSPFILQLRKKLKGTTIKEIKQHNFDRILEFIIQKKEKYILVAELFSKGNFILCDENKKIVSLFEKRRWRDRTLDINLTYEYPPKTLNPFNLNFQEFEKILSVSKKTIVATLVSEVNLGNNIAEEVCLTSNIDKEVIANEIDENKRKKIYEKMMEIIKTGIEKKKPSIVLDKENFIDVVPFDMEIYRNYEKKYFENFNEAVDEYFAKLNEEKVKMDLKEKLISELKRLQRIKEEQEIALSTTEKKVEEKVKIANAIYQNLTSIEKILELAKKTKNKETLIGVKVDNVTIKNFDKGILKVEINS
ncbi:MAG: NFACT family protein [Candidatus Altiarchaeota archaeon]